MLVPATDAMRIRGIGGVAITATDATVDALTIREMQRCKDAEKRSD